MMVSEIALTAQMRSTALRVSPVVFLDKFFVIFTLHNFVTIIFAYWFIVVLTLLYFRDMSACFYLELSVVFRF